MSLRAVWSFAAVAIIILEGSSGQRSSDYRDYERDQILSIDISNHIDELKWKMNVFSKFHDQTYFWKTRPLDHVTQNGGKFVDVHVMREIAPAVKAALKENELSYKILVENLKVVIESERRENDERKKMSRMKRSTKNEHLDTIEALLGFYPDYDQLVSWLHDLTTSFQTFVTLESLGKTFENRDIYLLKINPDRNSTLPGFWIDAGIHAREWITVSSAVHIIAKLLKVMTMGCSVSPHDCELMNSFVWYIVPLINPDGYSFTRENRLWRKNRSHNGGGQCVGVDLNRNFDVDWGKHYTSNNSCSIIYGGPFPGSENETRSLMTYWSENRNDLHAWLTLHSYGQFLMNRWSHVLINDTDEYKETLSVMKMAASGIFNYSGYIYKAGSSPEVLYQFSGGSADWFRQNSPAKHVYEMELRDTGSYHFVLPIAEIAPSADEAMIVVMNIASAVLQPYPSSAMNSNLMALSALAPLFATLA